MKPFYIVLISLISISLCSPYLTAQTKLEPPEEFDFPDDFEEGFDQWVPDELGNEPSKLNGLRELGKNSNGEIEYSVLENQIGEPGQNLKLRTDSTIDEARDQFNVSPELNKIFTNIVLEHLPHQYMQDKKWGAQSKRWAGVRLRRDDDDGKLETKRRYKMVNHGTWQKYSAELVDPDDQFSVELSNVSRNRKGATTFDVGFDANLKLDARQAKWVKGVQLYSVGAEGKATIRLAVSCQLDVSLDLSQFPPDIVMSPEITKAKIDVKEFKLDRVGKVGGEVAQQVSRLAKKELESKINEKEKKLVKKLNDKIEKNRDKLRLSIADAIRLKWFEQTREFLPEDIQEAVSSSSPVGGLKSSPPIRNAVGPSPAKR